MKKLTRIVFSVIMLLMLVGFAETAEAAGRGNGNNAGARPGQGLGLGQGNRLGNGSGICQYPNCPQDCPYPNCVNPNCPRVTQTPKPNTNTNVGRRINQRFRDLSCL